MSLQVYTFSNSHVCLQYALTWQQLQPTVFLSSYS